MGRGIFASRDIKEGELLVVEKAIAIANVKDNENKLFFSINT